ncbi:hypothetical protein GCM10017752_49460 [Streptomyces roseoviridis]
MNVDDSASVCCSCEAVRMSVEKGVSGVSTVSKACLRDRRGSGTMTILRLRHT